MSNFTEFSLPKAFYDNLDVSQLPVYGLTRGSYNTLINDRGNIASRKGYTLKGDAGTDDAGIKSAYTWETSTNSTIMMRNNQGSWQAFYQGDWIDIYTAFGSQYKLRYATWWDKVELKDVIVAVNGSTLAYMWTGGITNVASSTSTTITKMYAQNASGANTFTFDATGKTLTQTATNFVTLGFVVGDTIRVLGSVSNNGIYTISAVTASVITVSPEDVLVNEVITATTCIVGVLGKETWQAERFKDHLSGSYLPIVVIAGQNFTYSGGEETNIITVTADPTAVAVAGAVVTQKVYTSAPANGDFPTGFEMDIIGEYLGHIYLGHTKARQIFIGNTTFPVDCGYTVAMRQADEGGAILLDNNAVSISSDDGGVVITAGKSDIYTVEFNDFSDGTTQGELISVKKIKTSYGQASATPDSVTKIKNGMVYLSAEPTVDFFGAVEFIQGSRGVPLSYDIKRLLSSLDRTNVSTIYAKNYAHFLFPNEGVLLMYDTERKIWQPPQYLAGISCLSLDDSGNVLLHSSTTDESYTLFSGMTDNGVQIDSRAVTNSFTLGKRSDRKVYDEFFVEALVNGNAEEVNVNISSGYQGATGEQTFTLGAGDTSNFIETPAIDGGFGTTPFGSNPFGALISDPEDDPEIGDLVKVYKISNRNKLESFTNQVMFSDVESGAYYEIICFGFNATKSPSEPVDIKV